MAEEALRTRFHYGFYAAMEVEYDLANVPLIYEHEVELGKDPLRLDFLIIKKDPELVLSDPIGEFFRHVNIFEYKSPEDGLSVNDFYKVQAYGLLYKVSNSKFRELPIDGITLSIVRHTYPKSMIKALEDSGIVVNEAHPGIYRFDGKLSLSIQLIVPSKLPRGEYEGLRLLAHGATVEDLKSYAERAIASDNERIKENAGTVIDVCLSTNKYLKEAEGMYEGFKEFFKESIEKDRQKWRQEARQEGVNAEKKRVATDMLKKNLPLQLIEEISRLSESVIRNIAESIGVAVS